jgi:membrane-bound serine protease (ClpP class)
MIDDGLAKSIERRTAIALAEEADYLIYEIDTYGGMVQSAVDISDDLIELGREAHTVVYINTKAISAGAMISVSCQDIIMRDSATIGDCAPVMLGGKLEGVEREKIESFIRGIFERAAETNGYPAAVLKAMVTMQTEVYRVQNLEKSREEGKQVFEFFETDDVPKDPNRYDLENKVLEVSSDELVTLTASKAFEWGVARALVQDRAGVLEFLAKRDGVTFAEPPIVLRTTWSEEMVRKINHPAVMGVLFMIALLGVYVELNTPGLGLPGLVAVICFTVMIGSKYLVGMANWVEVALFVVGLILLMVEIFVLPGFGIAGLLGIVCLLFGLFGMLVKNPPGSFPWPDGPQSWDLFIDGIFGLSFGFLGFIILAWLLTKYLPRLEFLSGLVLVPSSPKRGTEMEVSMTVPPESGTVAVDIGDIGQVISTLRPTGKVKFGDCVVDCVAEGAFLKKGRKVKIIEVHGNRVVVKEAENQ